MAPHPHSIIYGLPKMELNGVFAPEYDIAGYDFSHDHAERKFYRVPGAMHQWTGYAPELLQFQLYFLNSLQKGRFPGLWNSWVPLLQNGDPQRMVHPLLGPIQVVVRSGSVKLEARNTSGIIVSVNFARTILDPSKKSDSAALNVSIKGTALDADAAAKEAGVPYEPSMPAPSLFDLLDQIDGLIVSAQMDALGLINQAKGYVEFMLDFTERAAKNADPRHALAAAAEALIALWASLTDAAKKLGASASRKTAEVTLSTDTTLDAFAAAHGNELEDIISLNVAALASPTVPKGTVLTYYVEAA